MRSSWLILASVLGGCGGGALDDASRTDDASVDAAGVLRADVGAVAPCSLGGTGRLRVAVTVDAALLRRSPEIWLSARCGVDDRVVRVVRWDRSATMVLDGFGPGAYSVVASSLLAVPARTARVDVNALSTASLSVTLAAEPAAVGSVRAGAGVSVGVDAGAPSFDVGAAPDAAPRPGWSARAAIDDERVAGGVGSVEVDALRVSDDTIELRVLVRNTCASSALAACPAIELAGVEARALLGDAPSDVALGVFGRTRLAPGESATLSRALPLRGELPGARSALHVAVFGALSRPAAAPMRP